MSFENRTDAGRQLAERLAAREYADPIVLGLPRGGVPVAFEVARRLSAPLDVVLVRKVGAPSNPEYGIGAVGEGGVTLLEDEPVSRLGLTDDALRQSVARERAELERRVERYRGDRSGIPVEGRTCIVVDDGLATGVSATAAVRVLRERKAGRIVVAVPVGAPDSVDRLRTEADEVVCLHSPPSFMAVGTWYHDFSQTTGDEVVGLLEEAKELLGDSADVQIPVGGVTLPGYLDVPASPVGLVVFAHGSGSSRDSPRNRQVAGELRDAGLGTLLFDLLTPAESPVRDNVFDIDLLARRLVAAVNWVESAPNVSGLPIGLFGASTGAAAALVASTRTDVAAVVSRGGRPDLASDALGDVTTPTLLVVGENDPQILDLNEDAAKRLGGSAKIVVVPGAGHLFEEPGALDAVADAARDWFIGHLGS